MFVDCQNCFLSNILLSSFQVYKNMSKFKIKVGETFPSILVLLDGLLLSMVISFQPGVSIVRANT